MLARLLQGPALRLVQYLAHRLRDRFVKNVIVKSVQQLFAVGRSIEKGGNPRLRRFRRRLRVPVTASNLCGHGDLFSYVTHITHARCLLPNPVGSCQPDDTTPTVCNSKCSLKAAIEIYARRMEPGFGRRFERDIS